LEETAAAICRVDSEERGNTFSEISINIFQITLRHFLEEPEVAAVRISDLKNNIKVLRNTCGNYRRRQAVYLNVICNVCDLWSGWLELDLGTGSNYILLCWLAESFLEREMFQTKVEEKIKTHLLCPLHFFFENCAFCEIACKNMIQPDRSQMAVYYGTCLLHAG
jgi:hypothetical protein